jgi:hypothetical protein
MHNLPTQPCEAGSWPVNATLHSQSLASDRFTWWEEPTGNQPVGREMSVSSCSCLAACCPLLQATALAESALQYKAQVLLGSELSSNCFWRANDERLSAVAWAHHGLHLTWAIWNFICNFLSSSFINCFLTVVFYVLHISPLSPA